MSKTTKALRKAVQDRNSRREEFFVSSTFAEIEDRGKQLAEKKYVQRDENRKGNPTFQPEEKKILKQGELKDTENLLKECTYQKKQFEKELKDLSEKIQIRRGLINKIQIIEDTVKSQTALQKEILSSQEEGKKLRDESLKIEQKLAEQIKRQEELQQKLVTEQLKLKEELVEKDRLQFQLNKD